MASRRTDLTIDQLLKDPVTLAVMKADGVDAVAFEGMLRNLAVRLAAPSFAVSESRAPRPAAAFPVAGRLAKAGIAADQCRSL